MSAGRIRRAAVESRPDAQGIRSTESRIWFDELPHAAEKTPQGWQVSWLPDRDDLTAQQAQDALLVAKLSHTWRSRDLAIRDWPKTQRLARGIGVNPREAVALVREFDARARAEATPEPTRGPDGRMRLVMVDAPRPPRVRTPGRAPNQWLASGQILDLDRGLDR